MSVTIRVRIAVQGGRAYSFAPESQEGEWPLCMDRTAEGALLGWAESFRDLLDPEEDCGDIDPATTDLLARLAVDGGTIEITRDDTSALPSFLAEVA